MRREVGLRGEFVGEFLGFRAAAFLHRVEAFLQVVVRGSQGRVFVFNYIEGALGYIAVFEGFVTRLFELTYCLEFFFPASFSA